MVGRGAGVTGVSSAIWPEAVDCGAGYAAWPGDEEKANDGCNRILNNKVKNPKRIDCATSLFVLMI